MIQVKWEKNVTGHKRVIRRFLLFPTTIEYETRWLEWAFIEQRYSDPIYFRRWKNDRWADWKTEE